MLRFVSGVPTEQIAAVYGVPTATMAARLTRAKKTLATHSHELYDLAAADLIDRVPVLRAALYAAWALAHTQVVGKELRDHELAQAVLRLVRVLAEWDGGDESAALAAICEFGTARWLTREAGPSARAGQHTLESAPREQWNWALLVQATARLNPVTAESGVLRWRAEIERLFSVRTWAETDWGDILAAHDQVLKRSPELTTALSRVVALSYVRGAEHGLADLELLLAEPAAQWLLSYPYTYAAKGHLLVRVRDRLAAGEAYRMAAKLARTDAERDYFTHVATTVPTP